jgi:hypothetical protein
MTAYVPGTGGTLPSDANTVEKAAAWIFTKAEQLQPTATYTPIVGGAAQRVVETAIKTVPDGTTRFTASALIPMNANSDFMTGRVWEKITPGKLITESSPDGATDAFVPGTGGTAFSTVDTIQKAILYISLLLKQTCGYKATAEQAYDATTGEGGTLIPWAIVEPSPSDNHGLLYFCRISIPINSNHHWMTELTYQKMLVASNTAIADDNKAI